MIKSQIYLFFLFAFGVIFKNSNILSPFFLLLENHCALSSIKIFHLCGLVEGKLTRVWSMRTLHLLGQSDWFKGGQVSQTGPLKSLPESFTGASWEGCCLLLHVDKDFSEKKTSKTEKQREKDTVFKSCRLCVFFEISVYLFMDALGLHCCAWAFSSGGEQGLLFIAAHGLLIVVACLAVWSKGSGLKGSVIVAHGLSCPMACGIFLGQGSNLCPLH